MCCTPVWAVFYSDTLGLGEIASIGGKVLGVWGLCPQRVPSPGTEPLVRGSGGEAPQKLEAFYHISSLFLSILEGIVWNCSFCIVYAIISYCS